MSEFVIRLFAISAWFELNETKLGNNFVELLIGKGVCTTFSAVSYKCLIDIQNGWS
jgi:hypothetical protein